MEEHSSANLVNEYDVNMDLTRYNTLQTATFFAWMVLWCKRNCKDAWQVRLDESRGRKLCLRFNDHREAIYFKMSPEYNAGLRQPVHFELAYQVA